MPQSRHHRSTKHVQHHLLTTSPPSAASTLSTLPAPLPAQSRSSPAAPPACASLTSPLPSSHQASAHISAPPPHTASSRSPRFPPPRRASSISSLANLRSFHRSRNRVPSSRNQSHHQLRRSSKRRRTLRRIQHPHSSARSRPDINQSSALSNRAHNRIHRARNRRQLSPHRRRHPAILAVHQPRNLSRRHAIEIPRRRIPFFRQSLFCEQPRRALIFLRLGSHSRIIQVMQKVPWRSQLWLCGSKHSNSLSTNVSRARISYARKRLIPAIH